MTHSPEPWQVERNHADKVFGIMSPEVAKHDLDLVCQIDSEADAERIVACVNACQGIPVETLESIARGTSYLKPTPIMDEYETIRRHIKSKALGGHMQCVLHPKEWETLVKHHAPDLPPNAYLHIDGITVRPQQHPGDWM